MPLSAHAQGQICLQRFEQLCRSLDGLSRAEGGEPEIALSRRAEACARSSGDAVGVQQLVEEFP